MANTQDQTVLKDKTGKVWSEFQSGLYARTAEIQHSEKLNRLRREADAYRRQLPAGQGTILR